MFFAVLPWSFPDLRWKFHGFLMLDDFPLTPIHWTFPKSRSALAGQRTAVAASPVKPTQLRRGIPVIQEMGLICLGKDIFDSHLNYLRVHMGVSWVIGVPLFIIHFERWDFPWNKPSIGGTPISGNLHICEYHIYNLCVIWCLSWERTLQWIVAYHELSWISLFIAKTGVVQVFTVYMPHFWILSDQFLESWPLNDDVPDAICSW